MINKYISFNNLVARISECRKRMIIIRHEMHMQEESGQDYTHQKREIFNLNNQINLLQSKLQDFQRKIRMVLL